VRNLPPDILKFYTVDAAVQKGHDLQKNKNSENHYYHTASPVASKGFRA
jgi:hypothetical protein